MKLICTQYWSDAPIFLHVWSEALYVRDFEKCVRFNLNIQGRETQSIVEKLEAELNLEYPQVWKRREDFTTLHLGCDEMAKLLDVLEKVTGAPTEVVFAPVWNDIPSERIFRDYLYPNRQAP